MKEKAEEAMQSMNQLGKEYPDLMNAFQSFVKESEKEGALSTKTKEIISVALSVATQCDYCIALHVKNALKEGATREELLESCFIAALMRGGPAMMYTSKVLEAIDEQ